MFVFLNVVLAGSLLSVCFLACSGREFSKNIDWQIDPVEGLDHICREESNLWNINLEKHNSIVCYWRRRVCMYTQQICLGALQDNLYSVWTMTKKYLFDCVNSSGLTHICVGQRWHYEIMWNHYWFYIFNFICFSQCSCSEFLHQQLNVWCCWCDATFFKYWSIFGAFSRP